jgi:hypothetical protein
MSLAENKFNHNDIVVIGDSFCAIRSHASNWPTKLVEILTGESVPARGQGWAGCHWWSTKRSLDQELKTSIPKVLIVCHTDPSRLPSDANYPLNYSTAFEDGEKFLSHRIGENFRAIQEASKYYYKYLQSEAWDTWAETAWYKHLDELIQENNIPYVIHLFCFNACNTNFKFKHGMISKERLFELSKLQPGKHNHLSDQANISIATAIADMITDHYEDGVVKDFNLLKLCK